MQRILHIMEAYIDAVIARDVLSRNESFPHNLCKPAAGLMCTRGYDIIYGSVRVDRYCLMNLKMKLEHNWNFDPERNLFIDITASQFNMHLSPGRELQDIEIWEPGKSVRHDLIYIPYSRETPEGVRMRL